MVVLEEEKIRESRWSVLTGIATGTEEINEVNFLFANLSIVVSVPVKLAEVLAGKDVATTQSFLFGTPLRRAFDTLESKCMKQVGFRHDK